MSAGGGVDLETVRERLGHGSVVTTCKYLHAVPGADQAAVRAFEAYRWMNTTRGRSRGRFSPRTE
jgi:site-specific recombinase XerD